MTSKIPFKIHSLDKVSVIAPSDSMKKGSKTIDLARERFEKEFGVKLVLSKNCLSEDPYSSAAIKLRINDLHNAFLDNSVKAIICLTGGYNANELLPFIDWDILIQNPKIFIGSSDNTVMINAIFAKTGLITYYGPNFFKFGMIQGLEYTLNYFKNCLVIDKPYRIRPSKKWSNDKWFKDQEERGFIDNKGYLVCNTGTAQGEIIGGNLCSLNLLQGTEYLPTLNNPILFIEDDDLVGEACFGEFNRNLESFLQLPGSDSIKGIVVGRFPKNCFMTDEKIKYVLNKPKLKNIPIVANADFGHCDPTFTFPIGGTVSLEVRNNNIDIRIISH